MEEAAKTTGEDKRLFRPQKLTADDIRAGCVKLYGNDGVETEICVVNEELRQGLDFVQKYSKSVTIFGSARTPVGHKYYEKARRIAYRAAKELGFSVITGGGPGIMEAGNRGAYEANGVSLGMSIVLPHEQVLNPYLTQNIPFYFFFTRKTAMRYGSRAYVFFPGGYGTMDELMESLTLVQTHKTSPVPIILVGVEFWALFDNFVKKDLAEEHMIGEFDPSLYIITDDEDKIFDIIKNAPERHGD